MHLGNISRPSPELSLNEKVAIQLADGSEIYVSVPYNPEGKKPDWTGICKFAREHPETKLFVWDGKDLRQL